MTARRVLAVIDTLGRGGAETLLVHLAPRLLERSIRLEVAALQPPYDLAPELEEAGVPVHRLDGSSGWRVDQLLPRLARLVARTQPDILHAHLFFGALHTGLLPKRLFSGPRVLSLHSVDYVEHPARGPVKRLRKRLHAALLRHRMTELVAVSRAVARHYQEEMKLGQIEVIYNALPVRKLQEEVVDEPVEARRRHGFQEDDLLVLTIGRFTQQKGHAYLIEAAADLAPRWPRLKVAIVGRGPLEPEYERAIQERSLSHIVRIVEPMPHQELMRLLAACDIFVMPSLFEGFGIATAEGMALARPTVATAIGPFLEFVEHDRTGVIVPPASASAIAEGIAGLLLDPERAQRLGASARTHIREAFDAEVIAARWQNYYAQLIP